MSILHPQSSIFYFPFSLLRVFLQISLELVAVGFLLSQDIDGQFLRDVVIAIGLLDNFFVLSDGVFLGLEDAFDDTDHVGRVVRRLERPLGHLDMHAAGDRAADLFNAVAEPLGVSQLFLDVRD